MSQNYILSIDQGTTGSTALLIDTNGNKVAKTTMEFPQHFPQASWVEHDLNEIWNSVQKVCELTLEKASVTKSQILSVGITNQRETIACWDRETSEPVCRAIVWQDRRSYQICEQLKKQGKESLIKRKTGLVLDPYFSASKLTWLMKNRPDIKKGIVSGKILVGTIDTYLIYRMTGQYVTDPSNASRTLLFDIKKLKWDPELFKIFKIPQQAFPPVMSNAEEYGRIKPETGFLSGVPVCGIAGDQQAALFGQACIKKGMAKSTYGTGAFVLVHTGDKPFSSRHRLLSSVAWTLKGKTDYCLEGSAFIAGAAIQWLRDQLGVISSSNAIESLARSVDDSDGVIFVPALTGMGAPHWESHATGLITGVTRRTSKAHMARATLEGVAFQVAELLEAMNKDLGKKISTLKVDGGASQNSLLMQTQANYIQRKIQKAAIQETTALGAAYFAGIGAGVWKSAKDVSALWKEEKSYKPEWTKATYQKQKNKWDLAIKAMKLLAKG